MQRPLQSAGGDASDLRCQGDQGDGVSHPAADRALVADDERLFLAVQQPDIHFGPLGTAEQQHVGHFLIQSPTARTQDDDLRRPAFDGMLQRQLQIGPVFALWEGDELATNSVQPLPLFMGQRVQVADHGMWQPAPAQSRDRAAIRGDDPILRLPLKRAGVVGRWAIGDDNSAHYSSSTARKPPALGKADGLL